MGGNICIMIIQSEYFYAKVGAQVTTSAFFGQGRTLQYLRTHRFVQPLVIASVAAGWHRKKSFSVKKARWRWDLNWDALFVNGDLANWTTNACVRSRSNKLRLVFTVSILNFEVGWAFISHIFCPLSPFCVRGVASLRQDSDQIPPLKPSILMCAIFHVSLSFCVLFLKV